MFGIIVIILEDSKAKKYKIVFIMKRLMEDTLLMFTRNVLEKAIFSVLVFQIFG